MKKIKIVLLSLICIFTFYVSDKLVLYVESFSPIMKSIDENYDYIEPVSGVIEGDTIIVGSFGHKVNPRESYLKMNDFGSFNETFYVFDNLKGDNLIEDNMDKIIIGGSKKNSISFISEDNNYFNNNEIIYTKILFKTNDIGNNKNIINGNNNDNDFIILNTIMNNSKVKDKFCLIGLSNKKECIKNNYYLIKPIEINNSNFLSIKDNIKDGSIYYVNNLNETQLAILINTIKYNNINIIPLIKMIKE